MTDHAPLGGLQLPVFVVGTRAQLIKVAPVIVACERMCVPLRLLMTGQHKETMDDLIAEFSIRAVQVHAIEASERSTVGSLFRWLPRAHLGVTRRLREFSKAGNPLDIVVHGDTLSTLVGAVAGWRGGHRVIHLESGLTSGRLLDPFPEELTRRLVFRLTNVAFCPNPEAVSVMQRFPGCEVVDTGGNTILDAVRITGAASRRDEPTDPYIVASLHRFQNIYSSRRLRQLVDLIVEIASSTPVHFVLHPATRKRLEREKLLDRLASTPGVRTSPRLGYSEFLSLAARSACVLTDGGSNQEELAALGVPTVVMRERTERPDGLGRNAVMESDIANGVADFVRSRSYTALRRAGIEGEALGPSLLIASYLARPRTFANGRNR